MASARACRMDVKEPTLMSNLLSYYSSKSAKEPCIEGVNVFAGEHAVVKYALEQGIIGADEGGAGEDREGQTEDGEPEVPAECERVTASQIDTSVTLSANTIDALFWSEGEKSEETAEHTLFATISHIEDENTTLSQKDTSTALSANTVHDIFGGEDLDVSACVGRSGTVVEPVMPTNLRRRNAVAGSVARTNSGEACGLLQEDVNIMKEEDNADEYETKDSE